MGKIQLSVYYSTSSDDNPKVCFCYFRSLKIYHPCLLSVFRCFIIELDFCNLNQSSNYFSLSCFGPLGIHLYLGLCDRTLKTASLQFSFQLVAMFFGMSSGFSSNNKIC